MRKLFLILGIVVGVIIVLATLGYVTLIPKPLRPPDRVADLAELEAYLDKLTGHNPDSPPGLSLVVVKDGQNLRPHHPHRRPRREP